MTFGRDIKTGDVILGVYTGIGMASLGDDGITVTRMQVQSLDPNAVYAVEYIPDETEDDEF